jgi:hypothetical protein
VETRSKCVTSYSLFKNAWGSSRWRPEASLEESRSSRERKMAGRNRKPESEKERDPRRVTYIADIQPECVLDLHMQRSKLITRLHIELCRCGDLIALATSQVVVCPT